MTTADASTQNDRPLAPEAIFLRQKAAFRKNPAPSDTERREVLEALETVIADNQEAIAEAVNLDFGNRSACETRLIDVFPTVTGIAHTRRHLKKWMRRQRRHVSPWYAGASNTVIPQPKGVVGVVSPWNYPLQLAFSPVTSAVAAGNRCMMKMASNSQRLCRLMRQLLSTAVDQDWIAVLPGVGAAEFTALPYDHLVFTGSPRTGRQVMKAAAANLTPVTLELGGKSPTIVRDDFDIEKAVERIFFIKTINAGQTCVSPDYLFLPERRRDAFVAAARKNVQRRYGVLDSPDYTSIIDDRAYRRLVAALDDARHKGGDIINLLPGSKPDPVARKIPPSLVLNVSEGMILMQEEIFGPILPVKFYRSLGEAIDYINDRPRPLALYLFTNDRRAQKKVIDETRSGGVGINDCALHVAQHDMPFGGIGNSGMGQYHGYEGFLEFSKLRPVFSQGPLSLASLMSPPYGKIFERMYALMNRFRWL
jgi:coniferyl-aldehyde dehydrogenase